MKTILITGSTGFLGKHLVGRLLEAEPEDSKLRLMCRKDGPCRPDDRVEIVTGDIRSRDDVKRATAGVDEIYHLAGQVIRNPKTPWDLYDIHVEGTRNVCEAMRECGASKAVFVSTSGAIAVSPEPIEHTEDSPYPLEVARQWPYYLSKIYAERLARWYVEHRRLPIVFVNPSLLLGPGDERRSSTGDVELFLKGQILVIPTGGLNLVDVRDAAEGCRLAMEKGGFGERYLLGGANMTFHEWIRRASKISGARAPKIMFPVEAARFGAAALRKILPLVGKEFALDDASVQMSSYYWYCDSTKAREQLGFKTRDPNQTLKDTIEYLRGQSAAA